MQKDCRFCQIVGQELDSAVIFEDQDFISFLDVKPLFLGHTLLIPKEHYTTFYDMPDSISQSFMKNAKKIGKAVERAMAAEGSFLAINNVVSQSVPHVHLHIAPRKKGDGLTGFFWPRTSYQDVDEVQNIQQKIIKEIAKS